MICVPLASAGNPLIYGQKAARLASLADAFPVPEGFVLASEVYERHVAELPIAGILTKLDPTDIISLCDISREIRDLITSKQILASDAEEVLLALAPLGEEHPFGDGRPVAIRSSALQEDLPGLSFAGQYDSFLDVEITRVLDYVKLCWASLYSPRALSYRHHNGLGGAAPMAVLIQERVQGLPGVMFTANPNDGSDETIIEFDERGVVDGRVNPVRITMTGYLDIHQHQKFPGGIQTALYAYGKLLTQMFGGPLDVEYIYRDGGIKILQVRPLKVSDAKPRSSGAGALPILIGTPVGGGLTSGVIQKIRDPKEPFTPGKILCVPDTSPEWEPVMRKARALITDHGSLTSHATLVAREMNLPAMVGTVSATTDLVSGQTVTLDGNDLRTGFVYGGEVSEALNGGSA